MVCYKVTKYSNTKVLSVLFVLSFIFLLKLNAFSQQTENVHQNIQVCRNLSFSSSNPDLTLDLFLPKSSQEPVPCIIVIQGGGFRSQDGQRFRPFALHLAENGFAAALIAYRGLPEYTWKTTLGDTKEAAKYIATIAEKYNIDCNKTGVMGKSAGATLAVLLAVLESEELSGNNGSTVEIKAAVAYAGVYDFVSRFTDSLQIGMQPRVKDKVMSNSNWIGTSFSTDNSEWQNASAINHIDAADPPVLFLHCKNDSTVPWLQSRYIFDKMKDFGIQSEFILYEKGGHGFRLEEGQNHLNEMVRFFRNHLY